MSESVSMDADVALRSQRIGACVEAACAMEVLAPKAGNVSPGMFWNFVDLDVTDFLKSAQAIRHVFERSGEMAIGESVLKAVRATRSVVSTNTNLGQILLLAPLVAVAHMKGMISSESVGSILQATTIEDSVHTFSAISLAKPGGLGKRADQDVAEKPTCTLLEAMRMAATYDDVAAQYANRFADVFELAGNLVEQIQVSGDWKIAVADVHMTRLTRGDTLVRRKCGIELESEMQSLASAAVALRGDPVQYHVAVESLDAWLRADGNRRNPGTTADLMTAALFVGLFDATIEIPAGLSDQIAQFIRSNQSPGTMGSDNA